MHWTQLSIVETGFMILISILIWLIYSVFAFRKIKMEEAVVRSAMLALSLLFFCLLLFRPSYHEERESGSGLFLTEEVKNIPDSIPVFSFTNLNLDDHVIQVPDLAYIERNHPEINRLLVLGKNLDPGQLKQLKNLEIEFPENVPFSGFTWLNYNRHLKEGALLILSGTYINDTEDTVKIKIMTAEGPLDSIFIPSGRHSFLMQARLGILGNYLGNVTVEENNNIRNEPLPYTVSAKNPLKITMLQAYPSFEMNYLKDWLAEQKHAVQVRVQISRDNFATQYINKEIGKANLILSENSLNEMDILISDAQSVRQFSTVEQNRLQEAVNNGLGVLILSDEAWIKNPIILGEKFNLITSNHKDFLPKGASRSLRRTKLKKLPVQFNETPLLVPVIESQVQETIAAFVPRGTGRIGVQLVPETFPWILKGEEKMYRNFWTDLIHSLVRKENIVNIKFDDLPFIWNEETAQLFVNDTVLHQINIKYDFENEQIARPKIDWERPYESSFKFIPTKEGWYKIGLLKDQELNEFVLPASAWKDLKQASWWRKHQEILANYPSLVKAKHLSIKEIPLIWWYLGFLSSIGFLWWREKGDLRNSNNTTVF